MYNSYVDNSTERTRFWGLLALAAVYAAVLAWRDEMGSPLFFWAILGLAVLGALAFFWWTTRTELSRHAHAIFFFAAGAFAFYSLIPFLFNLLYHLFPRSSLIWHVPGMDYIAELLWYAVPIIGAWYLFQYAAPADWRERFFLRLNWYREDWAILGAFAFITALVMWLYLHFGGSSGGWSALGTKHFTAVFVIFGVLSAAANALMEEIWFRGYFLGLAARLIPPGWAIAATALMFGFLHFKDGIPQGWLGLILAGIYGLALAWWTWKRGSIWQAVALHFTTDLVIFFGANIR
jgi:membrane protease YdiL (CAAX protease family)